ncbi:hypothetical protein C3L33_15013, partial [Rhododendron williamsianum]
MAFAAIYCSRAFSTLLKKPRKKSPVSSTRVVIDVFEPHPCFPKIDQSVLAGIVKQKNLDQLGKYDGVEGLACGLETNLESGISGDAEDVSRRSEAFGSNTYRRPPAKSLWQNRQFVKLSKVSNNIQVDVVRNGRRQQVSIFEIVVGDVVCLKIGDQVPADGLFIDGHSLLVDESSMTGESDHVEVDLTQNPFLFSGTKVPEID